MEDVTPALLGGATEPERAAFRMAALQTEMDLEVEERTAILLLHDDGHDRRERVAERVPLQWGSSGGIVRGQIELRPPNLRAVRPPAETAPGG